MPIVLLRVDERLIHGQVVVGWGEHIHMDRIAEQLGMDPVELRIKNEPEVDPDPEPVDPSVPADPNFTG